MANETIEKTAKTLSNWKTIYTFIITISVGGLSLAVWAADTRYKQITVADAQVAAVQKDAEAQREKMKANAETAHKELEEKIEKLTEEQQKQNEIKIKLDYTIKQSDENKQEMKQLRREINENFKDLKELMRSPQR